MKLIIHCVSVHMQLSITHKDLHVFNLFDACAWVWYRNNAGSCKAQGLYLQLKKHSQKIMEGSF